MKKLGIIFLFIVGIVVACVITCPDAQSHKDALIQLAANVWNQHDDNNLDIYNTDKRSCKEKDYSNSESVGFEFNKLGKDWTIDGGPGMKDEKRWFATMSFIDNNFAVNNYFLFSVGRMRIDKGGENISLGIFGHILTIPEDEFRIILDVIQK